MPQLAKADVRDLWAAWYQPPTAIVPQPIPANENVPAPVAANDNAPALFVPPVFDPAPATDGTIRALASAYQTDPDSPYRKLRYVSRCYYDRLLARIVRDHGEDRITDIRARHVLRWHEDWKGENKIAGSHSLVGMLRTIVNFGGTMLDDAECQRLAGALHKMRFTMAKPRTARLTAEQATQIRAKAHERGLHSIAVAQAIQFECILRQKDVIGEWVPATEPGDSDIVDNDNHKWLRGIRWEEIDSDLVLRHVTSKRGKPVEVPLAAAPMVMQELSLLGNRPAFGPVIVSERTGLPWWNHNFRRDWRILGNACGIPKSVRNMDSRAGAISEATDAGAPIEHVRQAATHSDISMTQRYSRGDAENTASVMRTRVAFRNQQQQSDAEAPEQFGQQRT